MITQTIQRWLRKMFAWWPWGRPYATSNLHTPVMGNPPAASDMSRPFSSEGPLPQTGMTSVAIEQERSHSGPFANQSGPPSDASNTGQVSSTSTGEDAVGVSPTCDSEKPTPTFEQRLAYLRYLYQHGLINEGFPDEAQPRQYRQGRFPE